LKQVNISIEHPDEDDDDLNLRERKDQKKVRAFGDKLKAALREVWKDPATDVFDIGYVSCVRTKCSFLFRHCRSQEEATRIDRVAEEIGTIQSLKNSFHPILNVILMALDAPAIFMRTKALRALGQIVTSDSTILAAVRRRRIYGFLSTRANCFHVAERSPWY
jgi:cohesin loading factor subunit SCC2